MSMTLILVLSHFISSLSSLVLTSADFGACTFSERVNIVFIIGSVCLSSTRSHDVFCSAAPKYTKAFSSSLYVKMLPRLCCFVGSLL